MKNQNDGDTMSNYDLNPSVQRELPKYRCHKEVWALKIAGITPDLDIARVQNRETIGGSWITPVEEGYAAFHVSREYILKHNPQVGGYYVVYSDGYQSFSPSKAFEEGYKRVT